MNKGEKIESAIKKKCQENLENDFYDWCESCGFTIPDFNEFLANGKCAFNSRHQFDEVLLGKN